MNRCGGLVKEIKIFLYRLSFHNIMILGKCNEWMRRKRKKYSDISHSVLDFDAYIIISSKYMASIEIGRGWPYFFCKADIERWKLIIVWMFHVVATVNTYKYLPLFPILCQYWHIDYCSRIMFSSNIQN